MESLFMESIDHHVRLAACFYRDGTVLRHVSAYDYMHDHQSVATDALAALHPDTPRDTIAVVIDDAITAYAQQAHELNVSIMSVPTLAYTILA
jgi:hypothetical protein